MIYAIVGAGLLALLAVGRARAIFTARMVARRLGTQNETIISGAESIRVERGKAAVLIVHGTGDTPQSLAPLAESLAERGYSVSAPLLPGHGRSLAALSRASADDWHQTARDAYRALRDRHEWVGVVGLSMGGAICALLAEEFPEIPAVALLSPYLGMPIVADALARTSRLWGFFVPYVRIASKRSVLDPKARAAGLAYGALPARTLGELKTIAAQGRAAMSRITSPTLVIQSLVDNRVSADQTRAAYAALASRDKRIEWLSNSGHVITVDYEWERVAALVGDWMDAHHPN